MISFADAFNLADQCYSIAAQAAEPDLQNFINDCKGTSVGATLGTGWQAFQDQMTVALSAALTASPPVYSATTINPQNLIAIIQAIIQGIMQIIQICPAPAPATLKAKPSNEMRADLAIRIRRQLNQAA